MFQYAERDRALKFLHTIAQLRQVFDEQREVGGASGGGAPSPKTDGGY